MGNSMLLRFFLLFFFFITFSPSSSSYFNETHKCSDEQSLMLLQFKQNHFTADLSIQNQAYYFECKDWLGSNYYPIMTNWNKSVDCCTWDGVTCNHFTGDVIGLDLSCGMLRGTIDPNTTLFHLPRLQRLNLAFNFLYSSNLPDEIGRFASSLTHLNLSNSYFSGQVPSGILLLTKLVSLDLSWNVFDFVLKPSLLIDLLQNSTLLKDLSLGYNHIPMVMPTNLNITSPLQSLNLASTKLQGKLPDNIFNLPYLQKLDLSGNNDLIGPLPKVNMSTDFPLKWLHLSFTGLSGVIPDSIGQFKSLNALRLSHCRFRDSLPKSLGNLRHLTNLDLSHNMLSGTLPSWLSALPSLDTIHQNDNKFSGNVPFELFTRWSLKELSLGSNQLVGEIDVHDQAPIMQSFRQLTNLVFLDLSLNSFRGVWDLDTILSSLTSIEVLDLSYSGLSVVTNNATHYANPYVYVLGLASCKLSAFPESLRALKNLGSLDLSNNEIRQIPDGAGEIGGGNLWFLNISHNLLTSSQEFQWYGLRNFYLQSNLIQGLFPPSICNMGSLSMLDMSNNSLGGVIPECLRNLTNLMMVNLGNNRFHGTIPDVYEEFGALAGLILNGNKLEGELPSSLLKCQYLSVLDLGNNHLNGTFPGWLGGLPNLQVLVLKSNKFHGSIEGSSIIELPFPKLRVLDVSHNGFIGRLPKRYFQTFDAMKNVVQKGETPQYLSFSGTYYSITVVVKGQQLPFPKISIDYTIIDLLDNRFEQEIPDVIGGLNSLIVLNLSHNYLTGGIPHALGNLSDIESLDLSWNQLIGGIPQSLAGITSLEVLNLSQNHLVGRIPEGPQFSTFETSFGANPGLCGRPLPKKCEHPHNPAEVETDGDTESGFTWKAVMLGYGSGTLLGLVMGYLMLSTGWPKWFNAIADAGEHLIEMMRQNKRRYVYIGK